MKKIFKIAIFVLMFSLSLGFTTYAATTKPVEKAPTPTPSTPAVVLATVNMQNAKIVSQKDNTFNITFALSNREGLQSDVRYGVKLIQESKTGQTILDEKTYEESLTLNPNSTTKKDIVYVAPASLSGIYSLVISSKNSDGFPFAFTSLGKVTLKSSVVGLQISTDTCYIVRLLDSNKSPDTKYKLNEYISTPLKQFLTLKCNVINTSKVAVTAVPTFETRYRSNFGEIVTDLESGDATPVSFKAGEKKEVTIFSLPLPKAPQSYNTSVTLKSKDSVSNTVNVNYTILGASATIQNISLDKDYFNNGDKAKVMFVYNSSDVTSIKSNIKITNDKGKTCSKDITQVLNDLKMNKVDMVIPITSKCVNPIVVASISDSSGTLLAEKELKVITTSLKANTKSNTMMYIIIIVLLGIVAGYIYTKKKNGGDGLSTIPVSVFFFIILALFGFVPTNKASADTIVYHNNFIVLSLEPHDGSSGDPFTAHNPDAVVTAKAVTASYYSDNANLTFGVKTITSGALISKIKPNIMNIFSNTAEAYATAPGSSLVGYTTLFTMYSGSVANNGGSVSFNVPSTAGTYYMEFADSQGFYASIPYVVVDTVDVCATPCSGSYTTGGVVSASLIAPFTFSQNFTIHSGSGVSNDITENITINQKGFLPNGIIRVTSSAIGTLGSYSEVIRVKSPSVSTYNDTLSLNNGEITFTAPSQSGDYTMGFQIPDGNGGFTNSSVYITVVGPGQTSCKVFSTPTQCSNTTGCSWNNSCGVTPEVKVFASPESVVSGGYSIIRWESKNATSCTCTYGGSPCVGVDINNKEYNINNRYTVPNNISYTFASLPLNLTNNFNVVCTN